jgi:iron complex transport system substrate-binding protein
VTVRRLALAAISAVGLLTLAACGSQSDATSIDDGERIVSLTDGLTESLFALGLGDQVVGRDISSTLQEASDLPIVTNDHEVNPEAVLAVRPTIILADEDTGPETALDQLREIGTRIEIVPKAVTMDGIVTRLRAVAEIFDVEDRAERLANRIEADLASIADLPDQGVRVAFLYLRGPAGVYLIGGPGSGPDSVIEAAGGTDAGTAIGLSAAFTPLTPEAIVEAAPDVILVTTTGYDSVSGLEGVLALAGMRQTPAGRNGRIITAEDGLLFSFGPRTPELVRNLHDEIARLMSETGS